MFHDAGRGEDEGSADDMVDDGGSEASEDWEDGTTLFSRLMETETL